MLTAELYDIGTFLSNHHSAQQVISSISCLAFASSSLAQPLGQVLQAYSAITPAGHHFFTSATPAFALDQLVEKPYPVAQVSKVEEVDAPSHSCTTVCTPESIKCLYLEGAQAASRGGIDTVYRIDTLGGVRLQTCKGQPNSFEVEYAAQCKYSWFQGNILYYANAVTDCVYGPIITVSCSQPHSTSV